MSIRTKHRLPRSLGTPSRLCRHYSYFLARCNRLSRLLLSPTQCAITDRWGYRSRDTLSDEPQHPWNRRVGKILILSSTVQPGWNGTCSSDRLLVFLQTRAQHSSFRHLADISQFPIRDHNRHVWVPWDRSHIADRRRDSETGQEYSKSRIPDKRGRCCSYAFLLNPSTGSQKLSGVPEQPRQHKRPGIFHRPRISEWLDSCRLRRHLGNVRSSSCCQCRDNWIVTHKLRNEPGRRNTQGVRKTPQEAQYPIHFDNRVFFGICRACSLR